jgi:hypothetical protein
MDADRPLKLIYVLGWGHSGSTLLGLMLGSADNVVSVGEIVFFDYYRDRRSHPKVLREFDCTCGEDFQRCPFWRGVLESLEPARPSVARDESAPQRLIWLLRLAAHVLRGRPQAGGATGPGDDAALLGTAAAHSSPPAEFVCDSSKDFARLARLIMDPRLEVYPIHLVRDARAVAWSYAKNKRVQLGLSKVGFYRGLLLWLGVNLLSRWTARLARRPYVSLSYERLCRDPRGTELWLAERLGLRLRGADPVKRINAGVYHDVGGNLMRFKKLTAIRSDDAWRAQAPRLGVWLGGLLMWAFGRRWSRRR